MFLDTSILLESNDYKDKGLPFHISFKNVDGQIFSPRIPTSDYAMKNAKIDKNGILHRGIFYEDVVTPRVCFSKSINGCINAIINNFPEKYIDEVFDTKGKEEQPILFLDTKEQIEYNIHIPEKRFEKYKRMTNRELVEKDLVVDAFVSQECWILEDVKLKYYGKLIIPPQKYKYKEYIHPKHKDIHWIKRLWEFKVIR